MEKEPIVPDYIKREMKEAIEKADGLGHSFGEWKWDGYSCWRIRCEMRNCSAHLWVAPNGEVGGTVLTKIDWMKQFKMSGKK